MATRGASRLDWCLRRVGASGDWLLLEAGTQVSRAAPGRAPRPRAPAGRGGWAAEASVPPGVGRALAAPLGRSPVAACRSAQWGGEWPPLPFVWSLVVPRRAFRGGKPPSRPG